MWNLGCGVERKNPEATENDLRDESRIRGTTLIAAHGRPLRRAPTSSLPLVTGAAGSAYARAALSSTLLLGKETCLHKRIGSHRPPTLWSALRADNSSVIAVGIYRILTPRRMVCQEFFEINRTFFTNCCGFRHASQEKSPEATGVTPGTNGLCGICNAIMRAAQSRAWTGSDARSLQSCP